MKKLLFLSLFLLFIFTVRANADDIVYVLEDTLYPYSNQTKPAKGASYTDTTYNTNITRITNASADWSGWGMGAGYSTWTPISSDGQHLIFLGLSSVTESAGYKCYNADNTYNSTVSDYLATYIQWWNSQDPEPRWDESGSHPGWLYYRKNQELRYLDITDGSDNLVHNFTADTGKDASHYIYNGEEGSSSFDSRYWGFMVRHADSPYETVMVLTYDKTTNSTIATKNITGHDPNNVMMSPSGDYIYVAYDWTGAGGEFDGPHAYTRNFSSNVKICSGIPHAVWAYDAQGKEVVFFMDSDMVSFTVASNGTQYDLYAQEDLGWEQSNCLHTAPNSAKKGWGFISTYSENYDEWDYNQIWAFELNETKVYGGTEPRIWRVSFTQNIVGDDYYFQQPNAQISRDGSKIWWGANWRNTTAGSDIYRVNLPTNWYTDLGGVPSALEITTTTLPNGTVGTPYSQSVSATGGSSPYTFNVSAGALPANLTISTSGLISGTPTGAGVSNFTAMVVDDASDNDTQTLSITINAAEPPANTTITLYNFTLHNATFN